MGRDPDCIFCKIIAGEVPGAFVLKTDRVAAFLDINPVAPGHLLVVPTDHSDRLATTAPGALASVAETLPRLVKAVLAATGAPACSVVVNDGTQAGQVIPHVHVHVIPRLTGDGLAPPWPQRSTTDDERETMRRRIEQAVE